MLNTGMGQEMLWVLIPFVQTKSLSMKLPVAPESKDRQDDRRSAGIEDVGRESSGESFFPFGPLRQRCPDQRGGREKGCVYRFTNFCIDFFYV